MRIVKVPTSAARGHVPSIYVAVDVGTRNLAVAVVEVCASEGAVVKLATEDITASTADACVLKLWTFLDTMMLEIDTRFPDHAIHVLIEQQPSKARSIMRSVELGARHYFLMAGRKARKRISVKSVSSKCKFSEPVKYATGATRAQRYAARKRASVSEMDKMLQDAPSTLRALHCGKADDVADCLCYVARHSGVSRYVDLLPFANGVCNGQDDTSAGGGFHVAGVHDVSDHTAA